LGRGDELAQLLSPHATAVDEDLDHAIERESMARGASLSVLEPVVRERLIACNAAPANAHGYTLVNRDDVRACADRRARRPVHPRQSLACPPRETLIFPSPMTVSKT